MREKEPPLADETQHTDDGTPKPPEDRPKIPQPPVDSAGNTGLMPVPPSDDPNDPSSDGNGMMEPGSPNNGTSFTSPAALVGWFFLGFFFGLLGLLVTMFLMWRRDSATRRRAITYVCLGILSEVVIGTIAITMFGFNPTAGSPFTPSVSSSSSVW